MALNIPSELAEVLNLLGMDWPQLDEDEIHRAARLVRQFRSDLEGTIAVANLTINDGVGKALSAQTSSSYTDAWNESREAHMVKLLDLLDTAADGIVSDHVAHRHAALCAQEGHGHHRGGGRRCGFDPGC